MSGNGEEWCFDRDLIPWGVRRATKGGNWFYGREEAQLDLTVFHDTFNEYPGDLRVVRNLE